MRIPIPHQLGKDEARRRLHERTGDIAGLMPGMNAQVDVSWPSADRMQVAVTVMGKTVTGHVDVEDAQVVCDIALPFTLSFVEPMLRGAIEAKGRKLLS